MKSCMRYSKYMQIPPPEIVHRSTTKIKFAHLLVYVYRKDQGSRTCCSFGLNYREAHFVKVPLKISGSPLRNSSGWGQRVAFFGGIAIPAMGFPYSGSCRAAVFWGENLAGPKTPKWEIWDPRNSPPDFRGKLLNLVFVWLVCFLGDQRLMMKCQEIHRSTWYWQSLQIQSPSENDSGTQTLCWGGDWTPQSSAENMTIDAWGLKFCLTPVVYHFTLDNRFNAVFCVVKDRSSSPKYLPLLPVSSTNVLRQRQVTSLWFQPTSKVWLKFDHLPMVTTGSNITNAYKYIRTNTVPNHHFSKHCWFLQASPECSLVFHCSATLMLSWVVCWLDPIMAGYSSQPP